MICNKSCQPTQHIIWNYKRCFLRIALAFEYKSEKSSAYRTIFTTALNVCLYHQMKTVMQKNLSRTDIGNLLGITFD